MWLIASQAQCIASAQSLSVLGHFLYSRIPSVENGSFDWTFFRLDSSIPSSYRQSSRFYSFCALPRGGCYEGVLLYNVQQAKSVGSSVLCAFSASNGSTKLRPSELVVKATFVELHSAESRQSYSRRSRCWQHGIETARCCRRVIHAVGERS